MDLTNLTAEERREIVRLFESVDMGKVWRGYAVVMEEHLKRNQRSRGRSVGVSPRYYCSVA